MAKVRLIAVNRKYRSVPFFMTPVYDENLKDYRTGQEKLSEKDLKNEAIIIDPEEQYAVVHQQIFDTNNKKDRALLDLAKLQPLIAPSMKKVVVGKHLFYLEDQEAEASVDISNADKMYEAMTKVKENASWQLTRDLAIFLGIDVKINSTPVQQSRIYAKCTSNPDEVLSFFDNDTKHKLFVLKCISYGILRRNVDKIVDGDILVGRTLEEAILFVQDKSHEALIGKWGINLERAEGKIAPKPIENKKGADVVNAGDL